MLDRFALSRYGELKARGDELIDGVSIEAGTASLKRKLGNLPANLSLYPERSAASDPIYANELTSPPSDEKRRTICHALGTTR